MNNKCIYGSNWCRNCTDGMLTAFICKHTNMKTATMFWKLFKRLDVNISKLVGW